MTPVRYTLVTDGSSDATLLPVLDWVCEDCLDRAVSGVWFDPRRFRPSLPTLSARVRQAVSLHPCDVLFVHRDAETAPPAARVDEVTAAVAEAGAIAGGTPHICVVPVRMTEAWLLFDEPAIRLAAQNPRGAEPLALPGLQDLEVEPDPKGMLFAAFRAASGLKGRRLKKLQVTACRHRLAELITDYSPLRRLSAFRRLEQDVQSLRPLLDALP